MIYKATTEDKTDILNYCSYEPEINLYMIEAIEKNIFDSEHCKLYLSRKNGEINYLILIYLKYITFYSRENNFNPQEAAKHLAYFIHSGIVSISGKKEAIESVENYLIPQPSQTCIDYFASCTKIKHSNRSIDAHIAYAKPKDSLGICQLYEKIPQFTGNSVQEFYNSLNDGSRQTVIIRHNNTIISTASVIAENSFTGMIEGVATSPHDNVRNKGYASACVEKLIEDFNKRGKSCCLFYSNPKAGSIYKKIGFEDIGFWKVLRF